MGGLMRLKPLVQGGSIHVLHHEARTSFYSKDIGDRDDVGMPQLGLKSTFEKESLADIGRCTCKILSACTLSRAWCRTRQTVAMPPLAKARSTT